MNNYTKTLECVVGKLAEFAIQCEVRTKKQEALLFTANIIFITFAIKIFIDLFINWKYPRHHQ